MKHATYEKFVKRWEEVMDLPPQTVGPLTPVYKQVVRRLKVMPWPVLVVVSVASVLLIYALIGSAITIVASILQKGI